MPLQPSLLITLDDTQFSRGEITTITVTVFNPTDATLESELYVEVAGPSGYLYYDSKSIIVTGKSRNSHSLEWRIPPSAQTGTYQISTGLVPPWLGAYDMKDVQVR